MPSDVSATYRQLVTDHRNMAQLLDVLQSEMEDYRQSRHVDFAILSMLLDYILNFPELRHHPRENVIFERVKRRDVDASKTIEDILLEHKDLAALARKLSAAIHNLRLEVEMPRTWFEDLVKTYIRRNREHMVKEEEKFFPLALKILSASDWQEFDTQGAAERPDPLFGGKVDAEYQMLHDRILRLAR
jgi:hemerythrin-like domain-containing protein